MRKARALGTVKDSQKNLGEQNTICKPPKSKKDIVTGEIIPPTQEEWKRYHNKIKAKRETLGGYQEYDQMGDE